MKDFFNLELKVKKTKVGLFLDVAKVKLQLIEKLKKRKK